MDLYVIVLIPHLDLKNKIKALKVEIQSLTGSKKALNSPAHITLQRPFRKESEIEDKLMKALKLFATKQKPFQVNLSNFDCFEPRVIFVNIQKSYELKKLHSDLNFVLLDHLNFKQKEINTTIHPHITIASGDLSQSWFYKIWPAYKDRKFMDSFNVQSIFLLKHNGKLWNVHQEFLF